MGPSADVANKLARAQYGLCARAYVTTEYGVVKIVDEYE
jgi:hypothetical protein